MEKVRIRKAGDGDMDTLLGMRLALQAHLEKRDPDVWRISETGRVAARPEIEARLKSGQCFLAVAEYASGEPVGMVMAEIAPNVYLEPDVFGHIHWLYVNEGARRLGIGRRLVCAACEFFKACKVEDVTVGFVVRNDEVLKFWKALGFRPNILHSIAKREDLERLRPHG